MPLPNALPQPIPPNNSYASPSPSDNYGRMPTPLGTAPANTASPSPITSAPGSNYGQIPLTLPKANSGTNVQSSNAMPMTPSSSNQSDQYGRMPTPMGT